MYSKVLYTDTRKKENLLTNFMQVSFPEPFAGNETAPHQCQ